MSAAVLPPGEREILRAIVMGLTLRQCANGWAFAETATVDPVSVCRLLEQGYLASIEGAAEITEAGRDALSASTREMVRRAFEWSDSPVLLTNTS